MQKKPANKVALITGSARRIGASIAKKLHAAGMNIVLHYNKSQQEAEKLCAMLNATRDNSAIALSLDLRNIEGLKNFVTQAAGKWGGLDYLINNASDFFKTDFENTSASSWNNLIDINLKAPYFLCQAAYPYLLKNKGAIVNIADVHGDQPLRDYSIYCISKAGLIMLTKALAKELGPNICVNAVSPGGGIVWPEGDNVLSDETKQKILDKTSLGREGSVEDIAETVLFLLRDASYITGQTLKVDGGRF